MNVKRNLIITEIQEMSRIREVLGILPRRLNMLFFYNKIYEIVVKNNGP